MPDYDFSTLSPSDFEILTRDLLEAEEGWQLEAFGSGPDGGIDLRTFVVEELVVVQCKHYSNSSFSDLKKACAREKVKMDDERPERYLLVTSKSLTRDQKDQLKVVLHPWLAGTADILTHSDLNKLLAKYPQVERSHFKLWLASTTVLDRIVHAGIWERSEALMEKVKDRVRLYVKTSSYDDAYAMIEKKRVVAITGPPGVGKSMLADMLCLVHWHAGWQIVTLPAHKVDEAWDVWHRDERQLFMFDDAFGQTDISEQLGRGVGATINELIGLVAKDPKKRLIITTRTQILKMAEQRDEEVGRAGLSARQCVVQVSDYGGMSRARILYNHLYFSEVERDILRQFVRAKFYTRVITHPYFTPRIIEQLVLRQEHASAADLRDRLIESLNNPSLVWGPSFRETLSTLGRMIVTQLVSFPVVGVAPETLRERVVSDSDVDAVVYTNTVQAVEGTWLRLQGTQEADSVVATFQDPSCRDFILNFLDSELSYLTALAGRTRSTSELMTLLAYALAKQAPTLDLRTIRERLEPKVKYPGFRRWIERNKDWVSTAIQDRWTAETDAGDDYAQLLARIYELDKEFTLDLDAFILDQTFPIASSRVFSTRRPNGPSCAKLLVHATNSGRRPGHDDEKVQFKRLFAQWCYDESDDSGWRDVDVYIQVLDESGEYDDDLIASMRGTFESALRGWVSSEVENAGSNADSLEEVSEALSRIGSFAKEYLPDDEIDDEVGRELSSQRERYDNYEPSNEELNELAASARAVAGDEDDSDASSSISVAELTTNPVETLFGQLE